ncbi:MAG TPA: glycosyl transferase family 1, partial [Pseudothermotoga sp.]
EGLYRVNVDVLEKAARRLSDLLSNERALSENVEKNFEIGKKYLSLQSLQGYLQEILSRI